MWRSFTRNNNKKMTVKGKCALYGSETELKESHIFPKFVIKHTKKQVLLIYEE